MFNKLFKTARETFAPQSKSDFAANYVQVAERDQRYPDVVYEIHNEFETASEKALADAKNILENITFKNKEKAERMRSLGFSSTQEVSDLTEKEKQEAEAKRICEIIISRSNAFPLHKFITEEIVKKICEKYSLVFGEASLFKGFLPEKNLKEIENFLHKTPKPYYKINFEWRSRSEIVTYISEEQYKFHLDRMTDPAYYPFYSGSSFHHEHPTLKICAPIKDMNTAGMTLNGYKLEKEIPDPVVLYPVADGFIIVTKWGNEANDPLLTNPIEN